MRRMAAGAFALLLVPCMAQAEAPDVNLGLWETITTTDAQNVPMPDMSMLPPEARARFEAYQKANPQPSGGTKVSRTCVTKADLEEFDKDDMKLDESCAKSVIKQTKTVRELRMDCPPPQASQMRMRFEAVSRTLIKGTMNMTSANSDGKPFTVKGTLTSKWLGADCGNVR